MRGSRGRHRARRGRALSPRHMTGASKTWRLHAEPCSDSRRHRCPRGPRGSPRTCSPRIEAGRSQLRMPALCGSCGRGHLWGSVTLADSCLECPSIYSPRTFWPFRPDSDHGQPDRILFAYWSDVAQFLVGCCAPVGRIEIKNEGIWKSKVNCRMGGTPVNGCHAASSARFDMAGASRDRVTIDWRGIGDAVRAAAACRGMGVAQLVR